MKRLFTLMAMLAALAFVGCSEDPYQKGQTSGGLEEEAEELLPAKAGRVVIAYVTWYGKTIPDPTLMTNINYAFAELYVKDGVYKGFKVQRGALPSGCGAEEEESEPEDFAVVLAYGGELRQCAGRWFLGYG